MEALFRLQWEILEEKHPEVICTQQVMQGLHQIKTAVNKKNVEQLTANTEFKSLLSNFQAYLGTTVMPSSMAAP